MAIHDAVYTKLSQLVSGRVYAQMAPQGSLLPRITWFITSGDIPKHLLGSGGLANYDIQIDCWGSTSIDATALGTACRALIENNRGVQWGNDTVSQVWINNRIDGSEQSADGTETPYYRSTLIASIWIIERTY